ncbi:hypothetical protein [Liquorilactobacillus capillatus]|uniref:Uncharacterized protein n=1 Tax=Liquorilactobacillus capillatus DSM 19910 TaxID=1423731 RepID=A0A0R1MEC4_9LACO|nr:hypothetical protein [Liquorilactobacillus capillatus]KRL02667.1 hypothetical protein FC81_GL000554 [Liquorilactobacillus capillatus DSM 19910]
MINSKQFILSFLLSVIICILMPLFMFISHYQATMQNIDTIFLLLQTSYWYLPFIFGITFFLLVFFSLYIIFRIVNFLIRFFNH